MYIEEKKMDRTYVQERRMAFVLIDDDLIFRKPDMVREFLSDFLVMETQRSWEHGATKYLLASPIFDETLPQLMLPMYETIIVNDDEDEPSYLEIQIEIDNGKVKTYV